MELFQFQMRNTDSSVPDILDQSVVRVQLADDGGAEDAKGVCHTVENVRSAKGY